MPLPTRSLYAIDPDSQKVRLLFQVTPDGWSESDLEATFAGLIPVLGSATIPVAILVSHNNAFVVRFEDQAKHFDIDEIDVTDVIDPTSLDPDPARLFDTVHAWAKQAADPASDFLKQTTLAKRVPEILPLLAGALLRDRDGSIGLPPDPDNPPVEG